MTTSAGGCSSAQGLAVMCKRCTSTVHLVVAFVCEGEERRERNHTFL